MQSTNTTINIIIPAHRSLSESDGCGRWWYTASSIASRTRWSLLRGWGPRGAPPYRGFRRIVVVDDGCRGCVARDNWVIVCCSLCRISDCSSRLLDMSTTENAPQWHSCCSWLPVLCTLDIQSKMSCTARRSEVSQWTKKSWRQHWHQSADWVSDHWHWPPSDHLHTAFNVHSQMLPSAAARQSPLNHGLLGAFIVVRIVRMWGFLHFTQPTVSKHWQSIYTSINHYITFTLSLESAPFVSSSTSFWYQFLHFPLTYSFTHHFFLFWFTTLYIYNSISLSLPA